MSIRRLIIVGFAMNKNNAYVNVKNVNFDNNTRDTLHAGIESMLSLPRRVRVLSL